MAKRRLLIYTPQILFLILNLSFSMGERAKHFQDTLSTTREFPSSWIKNCDICRDCTIFHKVGAVKGTWNHLMK